MPKRKADRSRRHRIRNPRYIVPGAAPGTLQIADDAPPPRLRVTAYGGEGTFFNQEITRVAELALLRKK